MSQLTLLPNADLLPGAAGYPAYTAAVYSKLNELAVAMSIAQFTTSTLANGQGNPAADMTAAKNKINELVAVFNSIPSLPATFFDFRTSSVGFGLNAYDLQYTNYRFRSAAAKVLFLTNAKSLYLSIFNNMPSGPPDSGGLLLYDGATFVGNFKADATVALPGSGLRIVYVVEGAHERPFDEGESQGTSLRTVTFPTGTTNTLLTPVPSDIGLVMRTDSIGVGLGASMPSRYGYVPRLRELLNHDVISMGWGYSSLGKSFGSDALIEAEAQGFVQALSPYATRKGWVALSTNDKILGYSTPPVAAANLGKFLDRVHELDPTIKIWVQSMLYTTEYTQPILDVASARSWCVAVNGTGLAPNSSASHVHPNDNEYAILAGNIATIVSGGIAVNPNEPAKGQLIQAASSANSLLTEVGPFSFYNAAADNDASAPGGTVRFASAGNASVAGKFTGTRLRIDFNFQPSGGMAELFIDGVSVGTFNQKSSGANNEGGGYFISPVLASSTHTFELKKAATGGGGNLIWSQFAVMDAGGTFTN